MKQKRRQTRPWEPIAFTRSRSLWIERFSPWCHFLYTRTFISRGQVERFLFKRLFLSRIACTIDICIGCMNQLVTQILSNAEYTEKCVNSAMLATSVKSYCAVKTMSMRKAIRIKCFCSKIQKNNDDNNNLQHWVFYRIMYLYNKVGKYFFFLIRENQIARRFHNFLTIS